MASRAAGFSPRGFPGFEPVSVSKEPLPENGICSNRRTPHNRNFQPRQTSVHRNHTVPRVRTTHRRGLYCFTPAS